MVFQRAVVGAGMGGGGEPAGVPLGRTARERSMRSAAPGWRKGLSGTEGGSVAAGVGAGAGEAPPPVASGAGDGTGAGVG